ncbi:mannan endo-1,4-beta-mannosidase 6-like [Amaranthus tricolor]|uniref:mannan endo-1,4-beta-mannosidase 6-like n=1 Tax=Amaranthus tricolor TaxID=29722 RepID=UPI00258498EB|nr:mannan endo-1,4-beta-mannosidase 6-like [Amaranthus tricolor]
MKMNSEWREKFVYPFLGIATITTIIYLNFNDQFNFEFPIVFWQKKMGFVGVNSTHFVIINKHDHDQLMYVNGWNSYWLMEESVWGPSRSKVSKMLKKGAEMGLNVCRTWGFSDGPRPTSLQISPGVFNERVLKGLDYVIVEARKNGIRLILSLVNNLNAFGGQAQYVKWAQEAGVNITSSADPFFSNSAIKGYYKDYIKAIVTRKNSLSRVRYSEEPAIFAWELINEPRCDSSSSSILQAWITEMVAYIKSLDQKHLVTIGLEGFYGPNSADKSRINPGDWAALLGTDFIQNSALEGIDFASVHAYPDSWMPHANTTEKLDFISRWLESHISDGEKILDKPVLFTEVGYPLHVKGNDANYSDSLLKMVYGSIFESAKKGQAGAGALIWQLLVEGMEEYGDKFSLVAWKHPFAYKLIVEQSCKLRRIVRKKNSAAALNGKDPCSNIVT